MATYKKLGGGSVPNTDKQISLDVQSFNGVSVLASIVKNGIFSEERLSAQTQKTYTCSFIKITGSCKIILTSTDNNNVVVLTDDNGTTTLKNIDDNFEKDQASNFAIIPLTNNLKITIKQGSGPSAP